MEFEGPHLRVSSNKLLQKYEPSLPYDVVTLLSAQNLFDSNFPEAAYRPPRRHAPLIPARGCHMTPVRGGHPCITPTTPLQALEDRPGHTCHAVRDVPWTWEGASLSHLTWISTPSQVVCVSGVRVLTRRHRPEVGW